jgi:pyruvate-formate lyase-activating enzyme
MVELSTTTAPSSTYAYEINEPRDAGPLKLGFGYTRLCNFRCAFCYSKNVAGTWRAESALKVVEDAVQHHRNVEINWGTGENILAPGFLDVLKGVHRMGVPQDITTNGTLVLWKEAFNYIDELDVSLDFPEPELHVKSRGHPMAFAWASEAVRYAVKLGIQTSIVMVGLRGNMTYERGRRMAELARGLGADALRLNLYFFTKEDGFAPTPAQIAEFIKGLRDAGAVLRGTSDPAVARIVQAEPVGYLGSVRLLPEGLISPSTYLTSAEWTAPVELPDFYARFKGSEAYRRFEEIYRKTFPRASADRVAVLGRDPYVDGEVERVPMRQAPGRHYIHLGYLPTTIFGL